jgi:hypothetical protein
MPNKCGLSADNMISYCADNAPVNFGKLTLYQLIKNQHNTPLIAANCLGHNLHNCFRQVTKKLPYDIKNSVIKVFLNEFSVSARHVGKLTVVLNL